MKRLTFTLIFSLAILAIAMGQDDPRKILKAAIYQEEVKGNIQEAIALYEEIVAKYSDNRAVVAEALYRNGLANEKLGTKKARELYEIVVSNYADQSETAALARKRLSRILKTDMSLKVSETSEIKVTKLYSEPGFYGSLSFGGEYMANVDWMKNQLYIMDFSSNKKHYIENPEKAKAIDISIWSYDNKKIAYSLRIEDSYHLAVYNVKTDKSKIVLKPSPGGYITPLNWTRDGTKLLIFRIDSSTNKLQLFSLENGEILEFEKISDFDFSWESTPTISPDMNYILYNTSIDKKRKIYIYSLKTDEMKAVVDNQFDNWGQKWEKEGNSFIYASDRTGSPSLYRMIIKDGKATGEPEMVYENINNKFKPFSLSDDGMLAFQSTTEEREKIIVDFDYTTGEVLKEEDIFDNTEDPLRNFAWSHDGKRIASMASQYKLHFYDIESGEEEYLDLDPDFWASGWNQWSGDDSEFMVESTNANRNRRAIINLTTKKVEKFDDIGPSADFLGDDDLVYVDLETWGSIIKRSRKTGEIETLCSVDEVDKTGFSHIRTSPNQKYIAFFEILPVVRIPFKYYRRLWIFNVETNEKELIWECEGNEYFGHGVINWTADSENLMVFFGKDNSVPDGPENDFSPYRINIHTKEKLQYGKTLTSLNNSNRGCFHPDGNRFIYSTNEKITNLWLLENLYAK